MKNLICPFCNKELSPRSFNHIYYCDTKELNKKEIRYRFLKHNYNKICNKDYLYEIYINKSKSLPDIKKEYELSYKSTLFLLDYYNIDNRTHAEGANMETTKNKYKKTCIKNYGVDNIWNSKEYYIWLHDYMIKKYGKKSLPNRYGNMNKYYDNMSEYDRKHTMDAALKGYVKYWNNLSDEQKTELTIKKTKHFTKNGFYSSKLETKISDCLDKLNISHVRQFYIGRKIYDIKISNSDIIIEINGDFWHGNPKIYKENDIINHPFKSAIAKDLWEKDRKKKIIAENKGYKVIYIWEKEINENKKVLLDFLTKKLSNK